MTNQNSAVQKIRIRDADNSHYQSLALKIALEI